MTEQEQHQQEIRDIVMEDFDRAREVEHYVDTLFMVHDPDSAMIDSVLRERKCVLLKTRNTDGKTKLVFDCKRLKIEDVK